MVVLVCNLVLAVGKLVLGLLSRSAAIMADGVNNLMDCIGAAAVVGGFRMAGRKKNATRPYGHGRMEYVSGFIVSMLIIVAALQMGQFAVERIVNPVEVEASMLAVFVLVGSIVAKAAVAIYLMRTNRKIDSKAIDAATRDSVADSCATAVVLMSMAVAPMTDLPVDGIAALVVSGFILACGVKVFLEHVNLLQGGGIDKSLKNKVRKIVSEHGIFERVVAIDMHDYGPENREAIVMVDLRPGVSREDVESEIVRVKKDLEEELSVSAVIYWAAGHEIRQ